MTFQESQISALYLAGQPIAIGGASKLSVGVNDAHLKVVPGLGVLVQSKGPDGATVLVPWSQVERLEIGGAALHMAPSEHLGAGRPPPSPVPAPAPAKREPAHLSVHELRARAWKENQIAIAEQRAAERARQVQAQPKADGAAK